MTDVQYKEFHDADYSRFRRDLIREKGGARQREFLEAIRDGNFMDTVMKYNQLNGSYDFPLYSGQLTECEFKNFPADTEYKLYQQWKSLLVPRVACRSTFWAYLTCQHISEGTMEATFLAAAGTNHYNCSGRTRIEEVLADEVSVGQPSTDRNKQIDDCVRTVLRRLGGLPEARGNRTVYVDCPFSRAWWRERLVDQILIDQIPGSGEDAVEKIREVLRHSQAYWEVLATLVVSRNSVLGSSKVRNAFIVSLAKLFDKNAESRLKTGKELWRVCRHIGSIQASRELSILDNNEIESFMEEIVERFSGMVPT